MDEKLIEDHYQSCLKRNSKYKYSREEHYEFWKDKLRDDNVYRRYAINALMGSMDANNNGYFFHPV